MRKVRHREIKSFAQVTQLVSSRVRLWTEESSSSVHVVPNMHQCIHNINIIIRIFRRVGPSAYAACLLLLLPK